MILRWLLLVVLLVVCSSNNASIVEHNNYLIQSVLPPGHTWTEFLSRGLLVRGNITSSLTRKFQAQQPLIVTAIGGSITCGSTLDKHNKNVDRYAAQLNNLLNEKYYDKLGSGSNVNKINVHCGSGETTEAWADKLLRNSNNPSHPLIADLLMSDIVILDTAVNDIEEVMSGWRDQNHFKKQLELLIVNLLAYPRLNIIVAGTCTRNGPWDGRVKTRHGDSLLSYLPLCKKYGITVVSVVDGLGDLTTNISTRKWWLDKFTSVDNIHPTKLGHTLIANLLLDLIVIQSKSNYQYLRLPDDGNNAPLYWDSYEILNANIMAHPITFNLLHQREMLNNAFVRLIGDWRIYEDIEGRPGFISTLIGSTMSFYLTAAMTQNLTQWIVHIDALKSYEHMSCLDVKYRIGETGKIHSTIFNMQWEERSSEHSILELNLNRTSNSVGSHSPSILLELVNSYCNDNSTSREINKIKAFAVTIY